MTSPESPAKTNNPGGFRVRSVVQVGFLVLSVMIGLEFRSFVTSLETAEGPVAYRPASVEAFLPISSLMSLTYLVKSGQANRIHPTGLVLFSLSLVLALAMRRGLCSWVCPIGTIAEYAHKVGKLVFRKNLAMPRFLDLPLRGLRYVLLAFFVGYVGWASTEALHDFIYGPYNKIADVKMYLLFRNISLTAIIVLGILTFFSVLFVNFWCRYLCPYGALLGLISLASPVAIRREPDGCRSCGKCAKACPNSIAVDKKTTVRDTLCTACYTCVLTCQSKETLAMTLPKRRPKISPIAYAILTIGAIFLTSFVAAAMGYRDSEIPGPEYRALYQRMHAIPHPNPWANERQHGRGRMKKEKRDGTQGTEMRLPHGDKKSESGGSSRPGAWH